MLRGGLSSILFADCSVRKSSLAPTTGLPQCLATAGGGPQLGQPNDPPIHGVVVRNHTSSGTGDDAIALFNVRGGSISDCHISDSFARAVLLYQSTAVLTDNDIQRCPVWHDNPDN